MLRDDYGYHVAASDRSCTGGEIAIALNGVAIFNGLVDSECNFLDVEDSGSEWKSFDCCGGHANGQRWQASQPRRASQGRACATTAATYHCHVAHSPTAVLLLLLFFFFVPPSLPAPR